MRKCAAFIIIMLLLLLSMPHSYATERQEPHTPSPDPERAEMAEAPIFSHPGGWYRESFELSLRSPVPEALIYYTLDGSIPTEDSMRYTGPITIADRSGQPNRLSRITTGTYDLEPSGLVFKASVLRARAFVDGMEASPVITQTYLVHPQGEGRYSLPVISLVAEEHSFFDYETGIYVPGKIYDDEFDPDLNDWERPANYFQRGPAWERSAHIEFFEQDGTLAFGQNIGVRIHGGATRSYPQKSLRLYARGPLDRERYFRHAVFHGLLKAGSGEPLDRFKRLLLRNSGNDWYNTLFRDALMTALIAHTDLDKPAYRPAVVLLNGEYWGIHNLRERLDQHYLQSHYSVHRENFVILEGGGTLAFGEPGDEAHYHQMLDYLRDHDVMEDAHYHHIGTQMDLDNYLHYQVSQIYFGNHDWPGNNIKFWRVKHEAEQEANGPLDGRWRWMLFDTDFGFSLYNGRDGYQHPTLALAVEAGGDSWPNPDWSTFLLRNLLHNYDFQTDFINRMADHLNTSFLPSVVHGHIDAFEARLRPEMEEHLRRWIPWADMNRWTQEVEALRHFASRRPEALRVQFQRHFHLRGTARLTLETDLTRGNIQINHLFLDENTLGVSPQVYPWTGIYFQGVPITIAAHPKPGYEFRGWQGADVEGNAAISLVLTGNTNLQAVFAPIGLEAEEPLPPPARGIPLWSAAVMVILLISAIILTLLILKTKRSLS